MSIDCCCLHVHVCTILVTVGRGSFYSFCIIIMTGTSEYRAYSTCIPHGICHEIAITSVHFVRMYAHNLNQWAGASTVKKNYHQKSGENM